MKKEFRDQQVEMFRQEIHNRATEIDPDNAQDWHDLTYGYFLGKGLSISDALELAIYIRYSTDLR